MMKKRLVLLALVATFSLGLATSLDAMAAEYPTRSEWGNQDVVDNGNDTGYHRTNSGAAWYYYEVRDNAPDEVAVPFNSNFRGKVLVKTGTCKEYGGFWLLARNEYNISSGNLDGKPAIPVRLSDLAALTGTTNAIAYKQPSTVSDEGANGAVRATQTGALDNVSTAFNKYKNTTANVTGITDWNGFSALTYFCASLGDKQPDSEAFVSFSTATMRPSEDEEGNEAYASAPVQNGTSYLSTITVPYGSKVTITFNHYLAKNTDHDISGNQNVAYRLDGSASNASGSAPLVGAMVEQVHLPSGDYYAGKLELESNSLDVTVTSTSGATYCQRVTFSDGAGGGVGYDMSYVRVNGLGAPQSSRACVTVRAANSNGASPGQYITSCTQGGNKSFIMKRNFFGNTVATMGVSKNGSLSGGITTSASRDDTKTLYAKPGDVIQFSYALCFGPHTAKSVGGTYEYITRNDRGENNAWRSNFTVTFGVDGSENQPDFLFGRATELLGQKVEVKSSDNRSSNQLSRTSFYYNGELTDTMGTQTAQYVTFGTNSIAFGSPDTKPRTKEEEELFYDCPFYTNYQINNVFSTGGYQIPGFQNPLEEDVCPSSILERTIDDSSYVTVSSAVGATIAQTLTYDALDAWTSKLSYKTKTISGISSVEEALAAYNQLNALRQVDLAKYYQCMSQPEPVGCVYPPSIQRKGQDRRQRPSVKKSASVKIPYNFDTNLSSKLITDSTDGVVYAGDVVKFEANVDILPRTNPLTSEMRDGALVPYATITPPATKVQIVELLVREDAKTTTATTAGSNRGTVGDVLKGDQLNFTEKDVCNYFRNTLGDKLLGECESRSVKGQGAAEGNRQVGNNMSNPEGEMGYYHAEGSTAVNLTIPDAEAGYKYCVAIAINYGDSHHSSGQDLKKEETGLYNPFYGANIWSVNGTLETSIDDRNWKTSPFSCRTIAKEPSMQVWNGATYSGGSINTTVTKKSVNALLTQVQSDSSTAKNKVPEPTYFGSWDEYYVIAAGTVRGFASAAGFGYNSTYTNRGQNLFGSMVATGVGNNITYCDISRLTIANNTLLDNYGQCIDPTSASETSNIIKLNSLGNYGGTDTTGAGSLLNLITRSYTDQSAYTISDKTYSAANNNTWAYHEVNGANYLHVDGDFTIDTPIIQTGGTKVIQVDGHLSIKNNICLGTNGFCDEVSNNLTGYQSGYSPNTNNLSLANRNGAFDATEVSDLPQVIIIAQSISIDSEVSQIDAWLITAKVNNGNFTYDGYVNTCEQFENDQTGTKTCWKTLKINGPVYTTALFLNRTGGAWAGYSGDIGNPAYDSVPDGTLMGTKNNEPYDRKYFYYANPYTISANNSANRDLTCDGSITPAEIFDLNPIVTYWVFSEAQKNLQVQVPFAQELAPRY